MKKEETKTEEKKSLPAFTFAGNIGYELILESEKFSSKYQVSNHNNLIALLITKEVFENVYKANNNPATPKAQKLSKKSIHSVALAIIEMNGIITDLAAHIYQEQLKAPDPEVKSGIITDISEVNKAAIDSKLRKV